MQKLVCKILEGDAHSDIQTRKYCSGRLNQARTKIALWRIKALEHSATKSETDSEHSATKSETDSGT